MPKGLLYIKCSYHLSVTNIENILLQLIYPVYTLFNSTTAAFLLVVQCDNATRATYM